MITRDLIVKTAQSWIGTRFHHQGRVKKNGKILGGCDCLGLIIGVAHELNIPSKVVSNGFDVPLYKFDSRDYGKKITSDKLYLKLLKLMDYKKNREIGDVVLFKIQNRYQHLGIYSYNHSIIHALLEARKVVVQCCDEFWEPSHTFSFRGISQ